MTCEQIHHENKHSLLVGDFNIDLLKESRPCSDNFINTLDSFFYQTHILQPTRITDHTATLTDIFFNSINPRSSLTNCQKLWHNCSLFVNTSFDTN